MHLLLPFLLPLCLLPGVLAANVTLDLTDRYIVTLHPTVDLAAHLASDLVQSTESHVGVTDEFTFGSFKGYAAHLPPSAAAQLHLHTDVQHIARDGIITLDPAPASVLRTQSAASHDLGLLSHRAISDADKGYAYTSAARGTWAYVLDSGIMLSHSEFEGRASMGYDPTRSGNTGDGFGHGTWVAGLIAGKTYGVAKKAGLVAVKVFDSGGSAVASRALSGVEWACKEIVTRKRTGKAVVSIAWGAGSWDQAPFKKLLAECERKGVSVVMAVGNRNEDTAKTLASAPGVVAVGATDGQRRRASFSNWGPRVSLFAPGVNTPSAWNGGPKATRVDSGSSASAAYVAGLVLYLKAVYKLPDAKSTTAKLMGLALPKAVSDPKGAPPLFAYNGSGK